MSEGSGTTFGYRIEARTSINFPQAEPRKIGTTWITSVWAQVHFASGSGVRNNILTPFAAEIGLLGYETARALMAAAAAEFLFASIEFRLVKEKMTYSYEVEEVGVGEVIRFSEEARNETFVPRETADGAQHTETGT